MFTDNLATPIAASLSDLLALVLLALIATEEFLVIGRIGAIISFILLLGFLAVNAYFTLKNKHVRKLIWAGWLPLLAALILSR